MHDRLSEDSNHHLPQVDVAIVGAGMAGSIAAQRLRQMGYRVVIVEKSRGVGGRVATRRMHDTHADLGLPAWSVQGKFMQGILTAISRREAIAPWTDTIYEFDGESFVKNTHWSPAYVSPAGINRIAKYLASGLEIWRQRRAVAIAPTPDRTWYIGLEATGSDRSDATPMELTAKAIVLATPAPQAATLLETVNGHFSPHFLDTARSVEYDPCITSIAGYSPDKQGEILRRSPPWRAVRFPRDPVLASVSWESSKRRGDRAPVFVFHSSAAFAETCLDTDNLTLAAQALRDRASETLFPWLDRPEWWQVHRWRYAFCRRPHHGPLLASTQPAIVACAGDWCQDETHLNRFSSIETALNSGDRAAFWVNQQLENRSFPPFVSLWENS
jgi:predicted NAD/FAD-dependent oxidoreductase